MAVLMPEACLLHPFCLVRMGSMFYVAMLSFATAVLQAAGPGGVRDVVKLTLQPEGGILMHAVPRVALPAPAAAAGP